MRGEHNASRLPTARDSPAARPTPAKNVRIPELDGLRGAAILLVLIWHYLANGLPASHKLWFLGSTWSGVDLFFVLSGFLIGGILIDARQSPRLLRTFYGRRFFRIVPLYWLVLCGYALTVLLPFARHAADASGLLAPRLSWYFYPFFLQNFAMAWFDTLGAIFLGATWSLAIEEQFYLTLPFVVRAVSPRALVWVCVGAVLLANLVRLLMYLAAPDRVWLAYVLMPSRMDALMLGVLATMIVRSEAARAAVARRSHLLWTIAGGLFLLIGYMTRANWMIWSTQMSTWGYTVVALFYTLMLLLTVVPNGSALSRLLRGVLLCDPLRRLGGIAYGVYLFHLPVNFLLHGFIRHTPPRLYDLTDMAITMTALGLTLTLATLSWRFFERPLVERAHRFSY